MGEHWQFRDLRSKLPDWVPDTDTKQTTDHGSIYLFRLNFLCLPYPSSVPRLRSTRSLDLTSHHLSARSISSCLSTHRLNFLCKHQTIPQTSPPDSYQPCLQISPSPRCPNTTARKISTLSSTTRSITPHLSSMNILAVKKSSSMSAVKTLPKHLKMSVTQTKPAKSSQDSWLEI